jgi:nitrate reductase NapE component
MGHRHSVDLGRARGSFVPPARLVRHAGVIAAPWRGRAAQLAAMGGRELRSFAAAAIGLWPLTGTMLVAAALLWAVGWVGGP